MEKTRMYPKPMLVNSLNMVSQLEAKIKESNVFKDKRFNWIGTCTLIKTNPNNGSNYEVGGMAVACFDNERSIAVLAESDMGLIEQFMIELDGYQKIYIFDKSDYELFSKHNEKKLEIVKV